MVCIFYVYLRADKSTESGSFTCLTRLEWPRFIVIKLFATPSRFARKSMSARLALPSTAGAAMSIFTVPESSQAFTWLFLAFGLM